MKSTETHTIVAAQPGWFLAIFDNTNGVHYEQIIAWEIRRTTSHKGLVTRYPTPITAEGNNADLVCTNWAVKRPDGKFVLHSNDMSQELLSQFARLTDAKSLSEKPCVSSPGIADGDPDMAPAPQKQLVEAAIYSHLTGQKILSDQFFLGVSREIQKSIPRPEAAETNRR
jgi:hypothetical protein